MFPSAGYFKGLTCPFFASGLCERQYCHFRHVKPTEPPPPPPKQDAATSEASTSNSNSNHNGQSLLSMVGKAVQHFQRDADKDIGLVSKKQKKDTCSVDPKKNKYLALIAGNEKYEMPKTISIPETSEETSTEDVDPSVPQYKPTPISQLKKKQKPKYVIPYMAEGEDASESEYDPTTNYSTGQKTVSPPVVQYKPTPLEKITKALLLTDETDETEYDPNAEYDPESSEYDPTAVEYEPTRISDLDICSEPDGDFSDDNESTENGQMHANKLLKDQKKGTSEGGKPVEKAEEKGLKDDLVSQIIFASDTTKSMKLSQVTKHSDGSFDFITKKLKVEKSSKSSKEKVVEKKSEKGLFDLFEKKSDKKTIVKVAKSDKSTKSTNGIKFKGLERKDSGSLKGNEKKKMKSGGFEDQARASSLNESVSENKEEITVKKREKHSSHCEIDLKMKLDTASSGKKVQSSDPSSLGEKHKSSTGSSRSSAGEKHRSSSHSSVGEKHRSSSHSSTGEKHRSSSSHSSTGEKHKSSSNLSSSHLSKSHHHSHHQSESHSSKLSSTKLVSSNETDTGAKKHASSKHGRTSSTSRRLIHVGDVELQNHKENLEVFKKKHRTESKGSQCHSHSQSHNEMDAEPGTSKTKHSASEVKSPGSYFGFGADFDDVAMETKLESGTGRSPKTKRDRSQSDKSASVSSLGFDFDSDGQVPARKVDKHRTSSGGMRESGSGSKLRLSGGEKCTFYKSDKRSASHERAGVAGSSKAKKGAVVSHHSRGNSGSRIDLTLDDSDNDSVLLGDDDLTSPHINAGCSSNNQGASGRKHFHISSEKGHKAGKTFEKSGSNSKEQFLIVSSDEELSVKTPKRSHVKDSGSKVKKKKLSNFDLFGDDSDDSSETSLKFSRRQKSLSAEKNYGRMKRLSGDGIASHSNSAKRRKILDLMEESESASDGGNFLSLGNEQHTRINLEASDESEESDIRYSDGGGDGFLLDDDDDGVDLYDECLKIFNESQKKRPTEKVFKRKERAEMEADHARGRARTAHGGAEKVVKKTFQRTHVLSPAEVMHNRFMEMRKKLEEAREKRVNAMKAKKSPEVPTPDDKRGSSLLRRPSNSSTTVRRNSLEVPDEPEGPTRVQTIKSVKSGTRKAHLPKLEALKRPTIPTDFGSKIPSIIRQRYLNLFVDECLKLHDTQKDAFERALSEEKAVYIRSTSKNVYLNVAVNAIKKLRSEIISSEPNCSSPAKISKTLSHEYNLGGRKAVETSFTLHRSSGCKPKPAESFSGSHLYHRLKPYILTEEQLQENGFPRFDSDQPHLVKFYSPPKTKSTGKAQEKVCTRCGEIFYIHPKGEWLTKDECIYHWGRAFKKRVCGNFESRYSCCDSDLTSKGCQVAKLHVHESNIRETLSGYMKTLPCSSQFDEDYGIFAVDCEMVYTTKGQELARVTVINHEREVVYETLVKPVGSIIDYNTRFSGITEEDLADVKTNLRDVQAVLLSLCNDKTILIGHSLESDLCALKLVHPTVVDTSVVFPHRMGLPNKRALRHLAAEILNKIIQNDIGGHDSNEDAMSCLDLMLWKVKDDIKKECR